MGHPRTGSAHARGRQGDATSEGLRVCLCSPHYPPVLDGVGDYTYFLSGALADLGCAVEVLTSSGGVEEPELYPGRPGVLVHREIRDWGVSGLRTLIRVVRSLRSDTICIQFAPHAYDRRGLTLAVNLVPALVRSRSRKRVVVNYHEMYIPFDWSLKRTLGSLWQRGMALLSGTSSDALLTNCLEWRQRLTRLGIQKSIPVIPVGSNIPRVPIEPNELGQVRSKFLEGRNGLLLGCFGSAEPHRDAALLRNALSKLGEHPLVRTVWLGHSGHASSSPEDSGISWTGFLPHPEISRIMSACDMFVLPFTEGVSSKRGTLAAALLHELPIVTTRGPNADGMFVHGKNMHMVPAGDPGALAEGLRVVAESPALRRQLSRGARELHDQHFAWNMIAGQFLDAIRN